MKRRKAIKMLGASMGFTASAAVIISISESCHKNNSWQTLFFNEEEFRVISSLCDLILPTTDTPGALDIRIPQFIDGYINNIFNDSDKEFFIIGYKSFIKSCLRLEKINSTENISILTLKSVLSKGLEYNQVTISEFNKNINEFRSNNNKDRKLDDDSAVYSFLNRLRSLCIFGYRTSEIIAKEVFIYDPIPGLYNGCVDLQSATRGKAWY